MAKSIGRLYDVGLAPETTRGVAVAPTIGFAKTGMEFEDKVDTKQSEKSRGVIDQYGGHTITKRWGEGSLEAPLQDKSLGLLLLALFGQAPTSTQQGTTGVYDHTWGNRANNNQHRSLTIAVKDPNLDLRFARSMMDTFKLEIDTEDSARADVEFKSQKSVVATNVIPYVDENEWAPAHFGVKIADNSTGIAAAALLPVKSLSLEINKNVEALFGIGSDEPIDIVNKAFEISGSCEIYRDDNTYRSLAYTGARKYMRIEGKNTAVSLGTGSPTNANPTIQINLPEIVVTNYERAADNDDIAMEKLEFRALFNVATSKTIEAVLTNAFAGPVYA